MPPLILLQAATEEIKKGYGALIFTGLFFLALLITGIWWLRRG
jgi:hypothetical protein